MTFSHILTCLGTINKLGPEGLSASLVSNPVDGIAHIV
jgi:hypothetical protein